MRNRVIEKDRGYRRIRKEVGRLSDKGVNVGFPADSGDHPDGPTMVEIAWWNEYGTSDGHVPERPFMRTAYDDNRALINEAKDRSLQAIYRGRLTSARALSALGQLHQAQIRKSITSLREPPNAPATIADKGSSNPLIDEDHLRGAVTYEVDGV